MQRISAISCLLALFALLAAPAWASDPDPGNAERERLFEALKDAPTEAQGRSIENAIWEYWMAAGPTRDVREDVAEAMRARDSYDFDRALDLLNGVVAAAPEYAEGWNQRAFIHFLKGSLDASLEDIKRALELEPKHFGALSGKALILMQQGRTRLGQKALREAVRIHPWLKERSLLAPKSGDGPPPPAGQEI